MVQTVSNKTILEEAWPMVRSVRPSTRDSVHVEIIGELTPDKPVQVFKFWQTEDESSAEFYAVSANDADGAARRFAAHCEAKRLPGYFISRERHRLWTDVDPSLADEYAELGGRFFETARFSVKAFSLKDFVIEYCRVM